MANESSGLKQAAPRPKKTRAERQRVGGAMAPAGFSWSLFEFARNPYFMLIVTYVFPPYFSEFVIGDPVQGQAAVAEATKWAGVIGALTAPILGAMMDRGGSRKPLMALFIGMLVVSGASLWWSLPGGAGLGVAGTMSFLVLGFVGYTYSEMMHNAMLRSAGRPESLSQISGNGIGLGQLSSALCLSGLVVVAVAVPVLGKVDGGFTLQRGVGPFVAGWLLVFVIPFFLFMPDGKPEGGTWKAAARDVFAGIFKRRPMPKWYWYLLVFVPSALLLTPIVTLLLTLLAPAVAIEPSVLVLGWKAPIAVLASSTILASIASWLLAPRLASYFGPYIQESPETMKYLAAALIYKDGMTALLALAGVYTAGVLGWDLTEGALYGIWASIAGVIGGLFLAGVMDRMFGVRRAIIVQLALLCIFVAIALGITQDSIFYGLVPSGHSIHSGPYFNSLSDVFYLVLIAIIAALAAANISSSRYMMITLAPKERISEFFGLYAMSSTATVWLGPMLTEWATRTFNDQRIGFSPVLLLLFIGLLLMLTLKKTTGEKGRLTGDASSPAH